MLELFSICLLLVQRKQFHFIESDQIKPELATVYFIT